MYRCLFRTARQCAFHPPEACVLLTKCDNAARPVFRLGRSGGFNPLSTSSTSNCENKDRAPPPPRLQEEKEDVHKDSGSSATPTEPGKEERAVECLEANVLPEQSGVLLRTEGGDGLKTEEKEEKQQKGKTGQSLLDLLGVMKVDVTSKKRSKGVKSPSIHEPTVTPKPAAMESTHSMFQKAMVEASSQSESLSPELVAAASAAAATLPNPGRAESELLKQLRQHDAVPEENKKGEAKNIGTIIADMRVGKRDSRQKAVRFSNQIHFDEDGRGFKSNKSLFERKRLGVFSPDIPQDGTEATIAGPTLWDTEFADQLVRSTNNTPRNGFEEIIQWTKEGKLWRYPIDNEAGMEEEATVAFHEHVFLDPHLEEGFPLRGPVRHFMELVVAGLSHNHHLSVRQKTEHIDWFRDYFQEKQDVLREAEALHS